VTTLAYQQVIEVNSLLSPILGVLEDLDYDDPVEIKRCSTAIKEMIIKIDIPSYINDAVRKAYGQLESFSYKGVPVSVRSSATAEDLPGTSSCLTVISSFS